MRSKVETHSAPMRTHAATIAHAPSNLRVGERVMHACSLEGVFRIQATQLIDIDVKQHH